MQWLIDMIIEAIGIPPVFIDRGDSSGYDFLLGDLTADGSWYDLDLSAIVPEGASAVTITAAIRNQFSNRDLDFQKGSHSLGNNISRQFTQAANIECAADMLVALDANRIIKYRLSFFGWTWVSLVVKGWWL